MPPQPQVMVWAVWGWWPNRTWNIAYYLRWSQLGKIVDRFLCVNIYTHFKLKGFQYTASFASAGAAGGGIALALLAGGAPATWVGEGSEPDVSFRSGVSFGSWASWNKEVGLGDLPYGLFWGEETKVNDRFSPFPLLFADRRLNIRIIGTWWVFACAVGHHWSTCKEGWETLKAGIWWDEHIESIALCLQRMGEQRREQTPPGDGTLPV